EGDLRADSVCLFERPQRGVAAIGIATVVCLAHSADEDIEPTPVAECRGIGEEHKVAAGHEGGRKAGGKHNDLGIARQGRVADRAKTRDIDHAIRPEPLAPGREAPRQVLSHALAAFELDSMPMPRIATYGLDPRIRVERPGTADGLVLPA